MPAGLVLVGICDRSNPQKVTKQRVLGQVKWLFYNNKQGMLTPKIKLFQIDSEGNWLFALNIHLFLEKLWNSSEFLSQPHLNLHLSIFSLQNKHHRRNSSHIPKSFDKNMLLFIQKGAPTKIENKMKFPPFITHLFHADASISTPSPPVIIESR